MSKKITNDWSRRDVLKATAASGAIAGAPMFFSRHAYGADFLNNPGDNATVADELRAYKLAVKHLNGQGDGGMMNTMQPSSLKGNGILGKKVEYVTGDTQTKSDAARRNLHGWSDSLKRYDW